MINIIKHLLPTGRSWRITIEKNLRKLFSVFSLQLSNVKEFYDDIYLDFFPQTTRQLSDWELFFGLLDSGLNEQQRRDRLQAEWASKGAQDSKSIQDRLQAHGFNVYVHEPWDDIVVRSGGSIDNDIAPTYKDPFLYLDDGSGGFSYTFVCGELEAQCGDPEAQCGAVLFPVGYPLVNKIQQLSNTFLGCGNLEMQAGDIEAQCGNGIIFFDNKQYTLFPDSGTYPYYLYIGGSSFPDVADVPTSRRDEFENLCLKICPTHVWLGILVEYS